ncbi:4'-phosphopantetheinyl transferase superfamily protein [Chitinophaga oryziterrae]|uniref:4'-phosphopantetheinyl transferase superfamily protein n=1 Tax=Chitinophaga oryziterrae TaxID=1031224 RepID=A0A6N8J7B6_9BACT|nr:type I polyketide synthase [Chitinophaga oryziterrae]MVT40458.1 4'-phosphopantetheinyl transferase superfamily protein [Chitinophaga oryziterrae]
MKNQVDIAIIGMSGIFPGAGDIPTFWNNIITRKDAIQLVPENRLDATFFDPLSNAVDRFYCRRGGFIDEFASFDPIKFGILPLAVEGTEPEQLLTLSLAQQALQDAGVLERNLEKTGIIIGKGNYTGPGATRAIEIVRTGEQIVQVLQTLLPDLKSEDLDKVKKEFQVKKGRFGPDTAMGLIPNLVASLVANRLNLGGAAYTIDAACASSLLAVDHAMQELSSHRSDMIIAGGVHVCQNAPFWSIFTQLGALSRVGQIRPFDQRADGLLIGEGCGFVVLKRLEDAIRDNDRIYAVVKGTGVSSDGAGTSVMSPSRKGQSKAILQAWQNAGIDVNEVGYIEAHGTGTPLGDKTELDTLADIFGSGKGQSKAGIGTVKSMIGHAMPAAGIAGLIKTALALYHHKLPPTLHCEEPLAAMQQTRFEPVSEVRDWDELPKLAGINAFGFGGINAHVVVQGFTSPVKPMFNGISPVLKADVLLLARPDAEGLIKALERNETEPGRGNYRIALFNPTPERIKKAIKIVSRDLPWRNKQDIWFTNDPLISKGGKIAFLFPGLDGLSGGEVDSVAEYFKLPRFESAQATSDGVLDAALQLLERSRIMDTALKQLGIIPDLNAGHSLGEWLAGRSSGLAEESSVLALLQELNPASFEQKDAQFLVIGCGYDRIAPYLKDIKDLYLSMDNCPQQVILCGTGKAVETLMVILREEQIFHQVLPFQSGFHSPFVENKLDILLTGIGKVSFRKTTIPLWSATTLDIYPESVEAIRDLSIDHLIKPVRFRELTEKLYNEGVRVFIQAGSGGLIGFVDDTLKSKTYSAIAANVPVRSGIEQLQRVLAALFTEGKDINYSFLGIENKTKSNPVKLQLGSPILKDLNSLKNLQVTKKQTPVLEPVGSPVMKAFQENCDEIAAIQEEIIALFNDRPAVFNPGSNSKSITSNPLNDPLSNKLNPVSKQLDISLDNTPYLIDHALIRQRPGWHCPDDMDPVIPMTMIFELFADIARENAPGKIVNKISLIQVFQWMNVATPFRETITGEWKDAGNISMNLENYANASVELSDNYQKPTISSLQTGNPLDITKTPAQIYEEHMFHGPAYQGIKEITAVGDKGITGIIESSTGKGSLLDNAGQLFGLWLQLTLEKDRIAFPVKIQEVAFYDNMQDQQGSFECTCELTEMNDEFATGNIILKRNNKVWAIITGWQNRRLEIDEALWRISMSPLHNRMSEEIAPGIFMFHNAYQRVVSWDFILKRYFNQTEKAYIRSLLPNKRKERIISRVAVKDAVRALLKQQKQEAYYPIEFEVRTDAAGKPFPQGSMTNGINISIAHKNTDAVGIARFDKPVGIDIEEISEKSAGFTELVFTESELKLITDPEWIIRGWVAKEAYGKYLGKGLQGNPKAYTIEEITGDTLRIKDVSIKTIKHNNYIIGWTL